MQEMTADRHRYRLHYPRRPTDPIYHRRQAGTERSDEAGLAARDLRRLKIHHTEYVSGQCSIMPPSVSVTSLPPDSRDIYSRVADVQTKSHE